MPAPAHDQVRVDVRTQYTRIAQDLEHCVRDAVRVVEMEAARLDLRRDVGDIAHDREQQLVDTADDPAFYERARRRALEFELDAAILLQHLDIELGKALEDAARVVVCRFARDEHRKRAAAQEIVQAALGRVAQARDLVA